MTDRERHILVPGLLDLIPDIPPNIEFPVLDGLFSRYRKSAIPVSGFEATLYYLFSYQGDYSQLSIGALLANSINDALNKKYWFLAEPVHLKADRDRLLLFHHSSLALDQQQAKAYCHEISTYFADENIVCLPTGEPMQWVIGLDEELNLNCHWLNEAIGRPIDAYLATGKDATRWRQLTNELQMLLYQSPQNDNRASSGQVAINGCWLSGYGQITDVNQFKSIPNCVYSNNNTAQSLATFTGIVSHPTTKTMLQSNDYDLVVLDSMIDAIASGQLEEGLTQLKVIEQQINIQLKIARKTKQKLYIYPGNGEKYEILQANFWHKFTHKNKYIQLPS